MIKIIQNLKQYSSVIVIAALFAAGCGPEKLTADKVVQQLKSSSLLFSDTDKVNGTVTGKIMLDSPEELNKLVAKWVIYWSDATTERGKTTKVCETGKLVAGAVCEISETKVIGKHFIAYAADKDGNEFFTKLSVGIDDKFAEAKDPAKDPEKDPAVTTTTDPDTEPDPVVATTGTDPIVETDPTVTATDPVVTTTTTATDPVDTTDTASDPVDTTEPMAPAAITILLENVLYDFDKAALLDSYMTYLDEQFESAVDKANMTFVVAGHADERGSNEYNLALGERRAYAVKRYLISLGFYEENVRIISYGEEKPADTDHNEAAWSKNRRSVTELTQ